MENPSAVVVQSVHFNGADRIHTAVALAAQYGVCLGIYTEAESAAQPFNGENVPILRVFKHLFPRDRVISRGRILSVEGRSKSRWLNYRLRKFSAIAAPLDFDSLCLSLAIRYQEQPPAGGIAGDVLGGVTANTVEPFAAYNKPVRDLLNELLLKSSLGGAWVVVPKEPEIGNPPIHRAFWQMISYGDEIHVSP